MDFRQPEVLALIHMAITEDRGDGDHSSLASISPGTQGISNILFKEQGVIAGLELAKVIFELIDPKIRFAGSKTDGDYISDSTVIATVSGDVHSLLLAERVVLNFMQRLSGISSTTRLAVAKIADFKTQILDTRKTTPGMRLLEKWAVRNGGGMNHRMGLYDMIMLKDNHIDSAGGIKNAVLRTKSYLLSMKKDLKIEVETRNLDEVKEALGTGMVHRIMLDNFTAELCSEAVKLIDGRAETEASGGIDLSNIRDYAEAGVDYISLGFLTHSSRSIDISMKTKTEN